VRATEKVDHAHLRSFIFEGHDLGLVGLSVPVEAGLAAARRLDPRPRILTVTVKLVILRYIQPTILHFQTLRHLCHMPLRILQLRLHIPLHKPHLPTDLHALERVQQPIRFNRAPVRRVVSHLDEVVFAVVGVVPEVLLSGFSLRVFGDLVAVG